METLGGREIHATLCVLRNVTKEDDGFDHSVPVSVGPVRNATLLVGDSILRLMHVAPELPPTVGGIADYTEILSKRLTTAVSRKLEVVLVHAGSGGVDEQSPSDFPVVDSRQVTLEDADFDGFGQGFGGQSGRVSALLLEYSGYGYSRHGTPWRLVHWLHKLRSADGVRVITVYHELYATSGRPWERAFWTGPVQYALAATAARVSDAVITNRGAATGFLRRWSGHDSVHLCPTFSNVGEPKCVRSMDERAPYAVLFGKSERKASTYQECRPAIGWLMEEMGIERIVDIGPRVEEALQDNLPLPVQSMGVLPKKEVSGHLQTATIGILKHPLHCLTKSGVWAAFAAHGVPALVIGEGMPASADGLREDRHFIRSDGVEYPAAVDLQSISDAVKGWYDEEAHSRRAAQTVVEILSDLGLLSSEEPDGSTEKGQPVIRHGKESS